MQGFLKYLFWQWDPVKIAMLLNELPATLFKIVDYIFMKIVFIDY